MQRAGKREARMRAQREEGHSENTSENKATTEVHLNNRVTNLTEEGNTALPFDASHVLFEPLSPLDTPQRPPRVYSSLLLSTGNLSVLATSWFLARDLLTPDEGWRRWQRVADLPLLALLSTVCSALNTLVLGQSALFLLALEALGTLVSFLLSPVNTGHASVLALGVVGSGQLR